MLELNLFTHKRIFRKYLWEVVKMCENDLMKAELLPIRAHAKYVNAHYATNKHMA